LWKSSTARKNMFPVHQLWIAAAVTVAFTCVARWLRGVSRSGAAAGAAACFLLYAGAGPGAFAALVSVFVLAWTTTRCGYARKQALGTAEKRDGRRALQVLANLSVAAVCAVLHAVAGGKAAFLLAMSAALSEAAADTVSSELGQAHSRNSRLITTWQMVPAGTDGGITLVGTLAGFIAAVVISLVCVLTGLLPWRWLPVSALAAVAGTIADSLLGSSLQRKGMLGNDLVNFLSTIVAAALAWALA
jgi:uncharacterized protein (TIGR00297 family)